MGFLGFGNYNKPGPGVNKDDPPKPAPIRFFEILWRKLSKFSQANLLFLLPLAIVVGLIYLLSLMPYQPQYNLTVAGNLVELNLWQMYMMSLPLILLSPFWGGLTFISRNFTREEHAFVGSDFLKTVKANWKKLMINGLITYLLFAILSFSVVFYFSMTATSAFFYVPLAICLIVIVLLLFAQYYIPMMIITFDLKLRQIYKNGFILALAGGLRNLLLTVFFLLLAFVIYLFGLGTGAGMLLTIVAAVLILFSFCNYLVSFATYPLIDKYLIQPQLKKDYEKEHPKQEVKEVSADETEEPDKKEKEDEDSYVYVNGRLIKKSEMKDDN